MNDSYKNAGWQCEELNTTYSIIIFIIGLKIVPAKEHQHCSSAYVIRVPTPYGWQSYLATLENFGLTLVYGEITENLQKNMEISLMSDTKNSFMGYILFKCHCKINIHDHNISNLKVRLIPRLADWEPDCKIHVQNEWLKTTISHVQFNRVDVYVKFQQHHVAVHTQHNSNLWIINHSSRLVVIY